MSRTNPRSVDGGGSLSHSHSHSGSTRTSSHEEIPEINEVVVRSLIHQKLDEVRSGDLYVMHNLKDDSVHELLNDHDGVRNGNGNGGGRGSGRGSPSPGSSSSPSTGPNPIYKKFESIIAKTWMDVDMISNNESGLNGGKLNRKKKMYTKALKASSDFVKGQIRDYINNMDRAQRKSSLAEEDEDEEEHEFPMDLDMDMNVEIGDGDGDGDGHDHIHGNRNGNEHEYSDDEHDANDHDHADCEEDTVSSLSDGKISRSSSSQKRKKKKKHKKRKHKDKRKSRDKERDRDRDRDRDKEKSSSSSRKSKSKSRSKSKSKSKKRKRHKSSSSQHSYESDLDIEEDDDSHVHDDDENEMDADMEVPEGEEEEDDEEEERELTPREQKRLKRRRAKAKLIFDKERIGILEQIPKEDQDEFRTLGFAKWGKDFLPCMSLGPYDVGPGAVRDQWMKMFENTLRKGRPMSKLIFWYGTPKDDLSNSFSFIAESKFISPEEGKRRKLDQLPARIVKKIDAKKKLTAGDVMLVEGLKDWKIDLNVSPELRSPWLFDFEEDYDDYLDQIEDETSDDEDEDEDLDMDDRDHDRRHHGRKMQRDRDEEIMEQQEKEASDGGGKKKRKKKKKQKQTSSQQALPQAQTEADHEYDHDHEGKNEKKSKKRKREKSSSTTTAATSIGKSKAAGAGGATKKSKKSKSLDEEIEEEVAEEDAMIEEMQEEPPSDDDEDDGDFQDDGDEEPSDEEDDDDEASRSDDDELYEEKSRSRPKQKQKLSVKKLKKQKTKEKDMTDAESFPTSKSKKSKKARSSTSSPHPDFIREQELFEDCEKIFLPLMAMLKEVYSAAKAEKLIRKIDRDVQKLTPSFIRTHQIGIVVKEVRAQFKDSAELNQLCKQLTSKMKKVFHAKLELEPKDFVPKVKKSATKKKKEKIEMDSNRVKSPIDDRETIADSIGTSAKSGKSSSSAPPVTIKELSIPQKAQKIPPTEEVVQKIPAQTIPIADEDMKETISKETKVAIPTKKMAKTPRADKPKPARKSFSLAGMFGRNTIGAATATPTPTNTSKIEKDVEMDSTSHSSNRVEVQDDQRPKWIVNYQPTGPNIYENDPDRSFAMEFLMEAVRCFPEGKVDPTSVARALEDALYTKYDGDHDKYMERMHDVCAAIAGKKQLGSVAQKIISGDYTTPLDVINIPRKLLFQSFEGFWIP